MALKKEELQIIGEYVQTHLAEWLPKQTSTSNNFTYPIELTERIVRVEEELKNQRKLMLMGFEQMDKRFESSQSNIDKRFESSQSNMDKRFESIQSNMDKRFELMQNNIDIHFELMQSSMDKRFDQVDKKFDDSNARMEAIETKMFHFMVWSSGFAATLAGIVIAVIKFT